MAAHYHRIFAGPDITIDMPNCRRISWRHLGRPTSSPGRRGIMFSDDASIGLYAGYCVTYTNLQIAAHLGLDPIIIIGCDNQYLGEHDANPRSLVRAGRDLNHFDDRYRAEGELVRPAPIPLMTIAFEHARAWADATGRTILNATNGGSLDSFARADLNDLLAEL